MDVLENQLQAERDLNLDLNKGKRLCGKTQEHWKDTTKEKIYNKVKNNVLNHRVDRDGMDWVSKKK